MYKRSALCALIPIVSGFSINDHMAVNMVKTSPDNAVHKPAPVPFTWEPDAVDYVLDGVKKVEGRPFMVALVGIPGSGKSTSCHNVADLVEKAGFPTMVMPFDGYHIPLDHLKTLPNADDAIYRRGAPDTFDPVSLKRDLSRIRHGSEPLMTFPGFDHAKGDPEPDQHIFIRSHHSVVICEGLYLLHDDDQWDLHECFDFSIFIDSDVDKAMSRLKIRNKVIPGYTPEEIDFRVDVVDRVNAHIVNRSKDRASLVVKSNF
ncbi:uridine kinase [Fragilaria crotonensis]|nr:uridine kinase [Fragilaria crotonensis]KAI2504730.1 uridine kinase [Fragilaria crotonensis]